MLYLSFLNPGCTLLLGASPSSLPPPSITGERTTHEWPPGIRTIQSQVCEHVPLTTQGSSSANLLSWCLNLMIWGHLGQDSTSRVPLGPIVTNAPEIIFDQISNVDTVYIQMGSISAKNTVEAFAIFFLAFFKCMFSRWSTPHVSTCYCLKKKNENFLKTVLF